MPLRLAPEFELRRDVVPWLLERGCAAALDTSENLSALYVVNVERNGKIIYTWKGNQRNTHIGLYDLQTKQNEQSASVNIQRKKEQVSSYSQFLYPVEGRSASRESRLLVVSEDKYIEQFEIHVVAEEENKVVIQKSGQLPRAKVVDDLVWAQWDMMEQRLFYIVPKLESHLDIAVNDTQLKLVNFGYDYCQDQGVASKSLNLQVFTSKAGYNKTFTVSLEITESHQLKEVAFMNLGYYVAAYLPGQFLHLLNIQHPDMLCYSLFLTGEDARIGTLQNCSIRSPWVSAVLDCNAGSLYNVSISDSALLQFLQKSKRDCDRLAALHCALLYFQHTEDLERQIIRWISENLSTCHSFDPIQEFIIGRMCPETQNLDKLLPYTSLDDWIGFQNSKGFWEKLNANLESVKYAEPHLHYHSNMLRREWRSLSEETRLVPLFEEEDYQQQLLMGLMVAQLKDHLMRHLQYVGKKKIDQIVLDYVANLLVRTLTSTLILQIQLQLLMQRPKLHPLCWPELKFIPAVAAEAEKAQVRAGLVALVYADSGGHQLGSTKNNNMGQGIVSLHWEQLMRRGISLSHFSSLPGLDLDERGSAGEFAVFHIMSRILEAANGMCMPLPPDLDDTEQNEKLKFSILMRLPEALGQKVRQYWNHPINANLIARKYVKLLLEKLGNRQHTKETLKPQCNCATLGNNTECPPSQCSRPIPERLSIPVEFLPLNYLTNMLAEIENQGVHPYEKQDHVNARFVEETALKQTMTLLGLKYS
ncbi:Gamma-secretase-activating protein [Lonchura striata]|uniref:Gamma-secretase-activating protein n=1 Tax=Lonchura striata TaxID=40157 RepID=A0A218U953_9PASE|nr:Gamma-secretase-activating protein [Lonchura striata domestica]